MMQLNDRISQDLKTAMKAKNKVALRGIRAIKAAMILAKTDGSGKEMTADDEIKMLQKLVKQRKDSLEIFEQQNRADLAVIEKEEIDVIQKYLPEQMGKEALQGYISELITKLGASSMKDMGKIMGMANKELAGKADGKSIAAMVKTLLSS